MDFTYKFGTEFEGNTHDEIRAACELVGAGNITLKIGGPDARGDLEMAAAAGIGTVIAPMVESLYAVRVFAEACMAAGFTGRRGIMLESVTAWSLLHPLIDQCIACDIEHVTIGRSDLAQSMGQRPQQMDAYVELAYEALQGAGFDVSVGGGMTPAEAAALAARGVARFNTRHVYFTNDSGDEGTARARAIEALNEEARVLAELALAMPDRAPRLIEFARQAQKRRQDVVRTVQHDPKRDSLLMSPMHERHAIRGRPAGLRLAEREIYPDGGC